MILEVPVISVYAFNVLKFAPLNPKSITIDCVELFLNVTSVLAA